MGRKRQSNPLNLPPRVYAKHGAFYYHHHPTEDYPSGQWERLGTDVTAIKQRATQITNNLGDGYDKMPYWLDEWLASCKKRVELRTLAPRTLVDYTDAADKLRIWFEEYHPAGIEPRHVGEYLDKGLEMGRAVRANREKAALSVFFSWLIRKGFAGVKLNPCAGIRRNRETKRARYVENNEMAECLAAASRQVWGLAQLVYRTLQRPEDIITWTPRNIMERLDASGRKVKIIRNDQGKAQVAGPAKIVDIEITPEIDDILLALKVPMARKNAAEAPSRVISGLTMIHRLDGKPYTYDGLSSMLKRAQNEVRDLHTVKRGPLAEMPAWGFYDMKGKGATDMWLDGVALEKIQVLCGHDSIKTTEKYVKSRWRGIVQPNQVANGV